MLLIQQVTEDALQQQSIVLPNGKQVTIQLYFRPLQLGWFFNKIQYENFLIQGMRVTNSPNMLHQWQNQIPFGLACYSKEMREPQLQEDFSSGSSKLYLLTEDEVQEYKEFLENGN